MNQDTNFRNKVANMPLSDLIFVNPVGTGYSAAIAPNKNRDFWGVDEDASSIAQFIKRYVQEGTRWAHLDIAGMVWASKPSHLWDKGATAYGVALLDRFVATVLER